MKKLREVWQGLGFSQKTTILFILFFIVFSPLFFFIYTRKNILNNRAAEPKSTSSPTNGPQYAPGEILVKFITPLSSLKSINGQMLINQFDTNSVNYSSIDQKTLPKILVNLNKTYPIVSIDKVFKGFQNPQVELDKFKTMTSRKIGNNLIDSAEQALLKNDLSTVYRIKVDTKSPIKDIISSLITDSNVIYAEPNYYAYANMIPNDLYYLDHYPDVIGNRDPSWAPTYDYQWNLKKINLEKAWDITTGNDNIKVAVVDSGVDCNHPDLVGHCVPGYDFIHNTNTPDDDFGHGSHVSGLIVGNTNNALGIASPAWKGKIIPVKVLDNTGTGLNSIIAQGIVFATDNGANIINLSLGNRDPFTPIPQVEKDALDYAYYHNILIVAAAGNSELLHPGCQFGYWPADYRFVVKVAASDENDQRASYSNCSNDVYAPGGSGGGSGSYIISLASPIVGWIPSILVGQNYVRLAGTSMAAPEVAGLSLLALSIHPNYTQEEIRSVLKSGADTVHYMSRINAYNTLVQDQPKIAFITQPAEYDTVTGTMPISVLLRNIDTWNGSITIEIFPGWITDIHRSGLPVFDSHLPQLQPLTLNYQGLLTNWDSSSTPDGKYTVYFTPYGQEFPNYVHITLKKDVSLITPTPTPTPSIIPKQTINLLQGWNWITLKLTPANTEIASVLSSISGNYDRVLAEDGVYATWISPIYDTLLNVVPGGMYIIHMTNPATLLLNGPLVSESQPISLHTGWNWIGYYGSISMPIETAFSSISGKYQRVLSQDLYYDAANPNMSSLHTLEPNQGYTIYSNIDQTFMYPTQSIPISVQITTSNNLCSKTITNQYTNIYGDLSKAGLGIDINKKYSVKLINANGVVDGCGSIEKGKLTITRAFGQETINGKTYPGFNTGENIMVEITDVLTKKSLGTFSTDLQYAADNLTHQVTIKKTSLPTPSQACAGKPNGSSSCLICPTCSPGKTCVNSSCTIGKCQNGQCVPSK